MESFAEKLLEAPYRKENNKPAFDNSKYDEKRTSAHARKKEKCKGRRRHNWRNEQKIRQSRKKQNFYLNPKRSVELEKLSMEERNARTVLVMQLNPATNKMILKKFFEEAGDVKDVQLIVCPKTKKFKGIAYVEFEKIESVSFALKLNGKTFLNAPIAIKHTEAEKNKSIEDVLGNGPMKLYVGPLNSNISKSVLRKIFSPFGEIASTDLTIDLNTESPKIFGLVTFHNSNDGKQAIEHLNGFKLAGNYMRVEDITEMNIQHGLVSDSVDTAVSRPVFGDVEKPLPDLVYKLSHSTGLQISNTTATCYDYLEQLPTASFSATQCITISNFFDPTLDYEAGSSFENDIIEKVITILNRNGIAPVHIQLDKGLLKRSVFIKCLSVQGAVAAVKIFNGKTFGNNVTADFITLTKYYSLFPEAVPSTKPLLSSKN